MKCVVLALALAFGLAWGVLQGMIMIQPEDRRAVKRWIREYRPNGVRNHAWFGMYHWLGAVMMLLGLALVMAWDVWRVASTGSGAGVAWSFGCAAMGWEASELGYSWSRWAKWIPGSENLVALDAASKRVVGKQVRYVHAARVAVGIILLAVGGVL